MKLACVMESSLATHLARPFRIISTASIPYNVRHAVISTQLGVACEVIAPRLVPTKAGDRVKTDRRDAEKLARCHRASELTGVWVPDAAHEALRDLVRAELDELFKIADDEIVSNVLKMAAGRHA